MVSCNVLIILIATMRNIWKTWTYFNTEETQGFMVWVSWNHRSWSNSKTWHTFSGSRPALKSETVLGWCGSVGWVPACKPKGHWLDSQSGHRPGIPGAGHMRGHSTLMFLSLSSSLPSRLSKNKFLFCLKDKQEN